MSRGLSRAVEAARHSVGEALELQLAEDGEEFLLVGRLHLEFGGVELHRHIGADCSEIFRELDLLYILFDFLADSPLHLVGIFDQPLYGVELRD